MYIHISYDEGIREDSNIEAVIRKVCDEVSRVYGLEEDEMSILLWRTREQAIEYGHSFERELAYLTTHSCLHILGYDHMNDEDKKEMRTEEEFILGNLGYVREDAPYNE